MLFWHFQSVNILNAKTTTAHIVKEMWELTYILRQLTLLLNCIVWMLKTFGRVLIIYVYLLNTLLRLTLNIIVLKMSKNGLLQLGTLCK